MAGSIIENLSGRKLAILIGFLSVCQLACFLVGGLIGKLNNRKGGGKSCDDWVGSCCRVMVLPEEQSEAPTPYFCLFH